MLVVLALFVWFALSVPAALFIGRIIAASGRDRSMPWTHVATTGHRLTRT